MNKPAVSKLVLIAGGSTLIYAGLALLMGIMPGIDLSKTPAGPGVEPLTELQAEGRNVYVANGCSYCHTQQVRPLDQDKVFGRPSAPGDFAYATPELLGSERTGPDLTNIGVRQPNAVWQFIHLYNPRAVVPESIMPAFDWLFEVAATTPEGVNAVPVPKAFAPPHGVVVPSRQAEALVAYLASLKQVPMSNSAHENQPVTPGMGTATSASAVSAATETGALDTAKGKALFTANCSACHQASGEGLSGAFPPLKGNAAVNATDPTTQIRAVLYGLQGVEIDGVSYSSPMPPFGATLSDDDIASIIDYERSSWGNHGTPVTAAQVAAERAKGK
jgi:cytochrome c oxidase cbb3-type subunit 2